MPDDTKKNAALELLPCSFKYHEFTAEVGEVRLSCHIIKLEDSLYLWVGDFNSNVMDDLSFALLSNYETQPISTKLMGVVADTFSTNMAKRLAKKLGKPVYVSFNVPVDNLSLPGIEKRVQEEFKNRADILCF